MPENDQRDEPDKIEIWGRRIGRALSYILLVGLVIYLFQTYIAP